MARGEAVLVEEPMVEARLFRAVLMLGNLPVNVIARVYVEDGKVLAVRSLSGVDDDGKPYPTTNDGKMTRTALEALISPSPRQLRDTANRPWED